MPQTTELRLVLHNHGSPRFTNRNRAARAVRAHSGQHHAQHVFFEAVRHRAKQNVRGRPAGVLRRSLVQAENEFCSLPHYRHVIVPGRDPHLPFFQHFTFFTLPDLQCAQAQSSRAASRRVKEAGMC